jgi:carbon monoxide dehydrogenase subunit G
MSVEIKRPIAEVWDFMSDPFNMPRLRGSTLGMRQTSPGPVGLGSTYQGRVMILGFESRISGAITEWDPPRTSVSQISGGPVRSALIRETFETTPDGTRLSRSMSFELGPAMTLVWLAFGWLLRRRWDAATRNIKGCSRPSLRSRASVTAVPS